jgi:hypothetical protein
MVDFAPFIELVNENGAAYYKTAALPTELIRQTGDSLGLRVVSVNCGTRRRRGKGLRVSAHKVAQSVPERFRRCSVVYFIGGEDGPIKIGFTTELPSRLRSLQNSSPVPIRLLAAVHGDRALEAEYHRRFAAHRLHGEWFERASVIIDELVEIRWAVPLVENIRRSVGRAK